MNNFVGVLKRNWTYVLGAILGGVGGYLYWYYIGCSTGTCPITSSPTISTFYGAIIGVLLFGIFKRKGKPDFALLLSQGAVLLDVRTPQEYAGGHAENSINIPLDTLSANLSRLKKDSPIITVCKSGIRSRMAVGILKKNGFQQVYNGGVWSKFNTKK